MNENFPTGRHSVNRAFNPDFEKQERICAYEHCIESMPFSDLGMDCPVFGHDCPGGISQVETCRKTKGRLRSVPLSKGKRFIPQVPPFTPEERSVKDPSKGPLSLEEIVESHFPKLMMIKVQLGLILEEKRLTDSDLHYALTGCNKILMEFLDEVRGLSLEKKGK